MALMAASDSWVARDTWRRRPPTVLASQKNAGTVMTATMASCQLMMIMATMLETNVTTLARIIDAVEVTTASARASSGPVARWRAGRVPDGESATRARTLRATRRPARTLPSSV
jgi:hypothetical protein